MIFKQISNTERHSAPGLNKRKAPRYTISPTYPLKAALKFIDRTSRVNIATGGRRVSTSAMGIVSKEWSGTLIDLSATGANVHLSLAAVAFPDDPCRIKFTLRSYQLEIPCVVAHFRSGSQFAMCGLLFNFPDPDTEKAYYQLLDPVIIGNSLAPIAIPPDRLGRHKEQFGGKTGSLLTIWRQSPGADVIGFDFRMNRYGVRWSPGTTELVPYGLEEEKPASQESTRPALKLKLKTPTVEKHDEMPGTVSLTEAQNEEVRWLFCLAVSNLSVLVSADVRKFLMSLVVA